MRPLRILLDCDDVLADTKGELLERLNKRNGTTFTRQDLTTWEVAPSVGVSQKVIWDMMAEEDFCYSLKPMPGSQQFVGEMLSQGHTIYVVTSPIMCKTWMHDREQWIKKHFPIPHKKIVQCAEKFVVKGDVLVDDKFDNVVQWCGEFTKGLGVLWIASHNTPGLLPTNAIRCSRWDYLMEELEIVFGSKKGEK